tara:strand:- start:1021 stop:1206 length:186 start_codon:yes stop_codon:yes gene_type:complete
MYATEKYVRQEVKEVHASLRELANDLGGDIRYISQELHDLSEKLQLLQTQIDGVREEITQK